MDVENFGSPRRTTVHQLAVRTGLYGMLRSVFESTGVPWDDCDHEDRGDAVFVLVPPNVAKARFVEQVPPALAAAVHEHNHAHPPEERIRLRMAVHAGEVAYDEHGVTAAAVNLTFRLLEAPRFKTALAESPGELALITSNWFFDEVVRHSAVDPATFRRISVQVKETSTTGWVGVPDHPYPSDPAELLRDPTAESRERAPRQLPAPPRAFAGRATELDALTATVDEAGDAVGICTISGPGGIGKTWLALRWANDNLDRFPDGQLFVDLRGFSPEGQPMSSAVALRGFLDALGASPAETPTAPHAQAALFRSLVAGARMLVVLDNAATAEQVAPLLPGSPTCTVLVTSRSRLPGLTTGHGARQVPLGVLGETQARALLGDRIGKSRMDAEPVEVDRLAGFCQGYPLALGIVAGRAEVEPDLPLASLVAELRDAGVEALDSVDPTASLPAVLSWSYRVLAPEQAVVLVLIGLAPGPDISLPAASALSGQGTARTRAALRGLEQLSLLHRSAPDRYQVHDLIRRHTTETADTYVTPAERDAALRRVVDFYLHTTRAADQVLDPHRESTAPDDLPAPGCAPLPLSTESTALAWLDTEHTCVLAAQRLAERGGWPTTAAHFVPVLHTYHWRRGLLDDQIAVGEIGLADAERRDDPGSRAMAHRQIAEASALTGRHTEAHDHLQQALTLTRDVGDLHGQAHTHRILAWTKSEHGEIGPAFEHITRALELFRDCGDEEWEARALNQTAWYEILLGLHEEARAHVASAHELHRRHHNANGEAISVAIETFLAFRTDRPEEALSRGRQAFAMLQDVGNTYITAQVLEVLGQVHLALGERDQARRCWQHSLKQYREQHREKEARRVRQLLDGPD
ncbi:tetratricopeptide repeat protein [Actinosynnema sp. NPDC047251]|uniref:ATP-binding protein n=1 Tax=Saccharothrix espanaensis TaxID=103731 RepID=UPI00130EE30F|nr:tetratricopeptide repeat protein [Saccharothrix espanaensis]